MDIQDLFKGRCTVTIIFPDSSKIQCVTTLSKDILNSLDLADYDTFIDLTCYRKIPSELLVREDLDVIIEPGVKMTLDPLDAYFQNAIKSSWEKV